MIDLPLDDLRATFGFGVAGNFAGHLEQAGEAADFVNVAAAAEAPKGIFPWFAPGADDGRVPAFLRAFPLSNDAIAKPGSSEPVNLQIEPEVGLLARIRYAADGAVDALEPQAIAAFNDCSIRRPGASKISEKKNWGTDSKGVAARGFAVEDLSPDGPTARFRLASFLRRGERVDAYGLDSPLPEYSYYGQQLLDWIVDRLAHQDGSPETPLEPVGAYLRAGRPEQVLVGIGATRYAPFGETTFLRDGDDSIVIVYDGGVHAPEQVLAAVRSGDEDRLAAASVLRQRVRDRA